MGSAFIFIRLQMLSAFRICISLYKKIERYGRNSSFNVASRNFMKYVILAVGGPV